MEHLGSAFRGRSRCPHCHRELAWYDLIPIFSYVLRNGRCRYCEKPIGLHYVVVEFATGLLSLAVVLTFGLTPLSLAVFAFFSVLLVVFAYDLRHQIIPDVMVAVATVFALLVSYLSAKPLPDAALGVLVASGFLGFLYLLGRGKWMGLGDVKLGLPLGLVAGLSGSILLLAVAFGFGALVGLVLLLFHKARAKTAIPFGPFLVIGAFVALFLGESIVRWYLGIF